MELNNVKREEEEIKHKVYEETETAKKKAVEDVEVYEIVS
jgi:hypothetical protein